MLLACLSTTQANYDHASGVRTSRQKTTAFFAVGIFSVLAVALLLACLSTTQANYDRSAGDKLRRKKKDGIFLSSFSFGLVLSERFSAQTSHLCSAPPLGCGTSRRFERLVWASLHLSERSRTIEVRVATLSAQTCTKSLTQSYMVLSIESIFVQQIKFGICGKDPLKTAVY